MKDTTLDRLHAAVTFALVVSAVVLVWSLFLIAHAEGRAEPLTSSGIDPLFPLAGRLGGAAAFIYFVTHVAKSHIAWLSKDERVFALAVVLGVFIGLGGAVEPMPSRLPFVGEILSGLGAAALAVTTHSGLRARRKSREESQR